MIEEWCKRKRVCLICCYFDKENSECRKASPPWYIVDKHDWCGDFAGRAENVD